MSSPMKGTKRKANNKDSNKPKRPTSSYFYFLEECRRKAKAEGRSLSKIAEFTRDCSADWKSITEKDKKKFEDKAAKDKIRYEDEMENYVPAEGEKMSRSKKVKDENRPKRPQSAYFLFLADYRKKMQGKGVANRDIIKNAGAEWGKLSATDKKPYEKGSEIEKKKYDAAMSEYNKSGKASAPTMAKKSKPAANGTDEDEDEDEEDDDDDEDDDEDDE